MPMPLRSRLSTRWIPLNSAVSKMTFGIKELKKNCECGEEVHTDMQFPTGASGIFVIHDAFEAYIKE
jgi:hypothetical protein